MHELGFRITNYDGGLPAHSTPEAKGRLVLRANGQWELHFAGGIGQLDTWICGALIPSSFQVTETGPFSSHVTMHDIANPLIRANFDVPQTPAIGVEKALAHQSGAMAAQVHSDTRQQSEAVDSGEWWEGIRPHTILSNCHYAGERDAGTLAATERGFNYSTRSGSRSHCRWQEVVSIEFAESETRFGHRHDAIGIGQAHLTVVGATKVRQRRIVTVTDTRGRRFHFVSEDSSNAERVRVEAIIHRLRTGRVNSTDDTLRRQPTGSRMSPDPRQHQLPGRRGWVG